MAKGDAQHSKVVLPPLHKKRIAQGVAAYALCVAGLAGWLYLNSGSAAVVWNARIPHADTTVTTTYATPQLTDTGDNNAGTAALGQPPAPYTPVIAQIGDGGGKIAIIMTDIGLSADAGDRAIHDLPENVALAISAYARNIPDLARQAKDSRREAILLLPMEPDNYPKEDPGPKALLTGASENDNLKNLGGILDSAEGFDMVMNAMGSRFLGDKKNMDNVFDTLQRRGVSFIEDTHSGLAQTSSAAATAQVPYAAADIVIDSQANEQAIRQALVQLEKIARQRGSAIGIAHPYPVTFNALKDWSQNLRQNRLAIVPPSTLMQAGAPATSSQSNTTSSQKDTNSSQTDTAASPTDATMPQDPLLAVPQDSPEDAAPETAAPDAQEHAP